jgi:hypothetical protein
MLAGRDVEAKPLGIMDHHAIGAGIDPAILGIACDIEAAGADIAPALVAVVPDRGWETGHVHRVAFDHVLHDGAGFDHLVRQRFVGDLLKVGKERLRQFDFIEVGRQAERHVLPAAAEEIGQDAEPLRVARNIVEQCDGRFIIVLQQFGRHADVFLPGVSIGAHQLAELVGFGDPFAQIIIAHPRLAIVGDGNIHGRSSSPIRRSRSRYDFLKCCVDYSISRAPASLTWVKLPPRRRRDARRLLNVKRARPILPHCDIGPTFWPGAVSATKG